MRTLRALSPTRRRLRMSLLKLNLKIQFCFPSWSWHSERRMYIQEVAASISDILESYKALSLPAVVSNFLLRVHFTSSLASRLSQKFEGGESLVTFCVKVVDFQHLALVVPIRLQSETTCTCDFVSTQQKEFTKVGEMLFSDVQKRHKSKGSKIKFTVVDHHTLQLWVHL